MAATVRDSTAATATNSPTSPGSTAIGDLVLVFHWTRGTTVIPTHTLQSGNGFVQIRTHSHNDGSTDGRLSCAYKIATSAGANAYNAYTSDTGTDFAGIVVLTVGTWEQADTALIGDQQNSQTTTNNGLPNPAAITTAQADSLVLVCAAWHLGSSTTVAVTAPTNYTEVWEIAGAATSELSVAQRTIATSGTNEDPGTFGDDVAPNGSATLTIAFRPRNISMTAASLALDLAQADAGLRVGRVMVADSLALDLAQADATMSTAGTARTMTADSLALTASTADAGLRYGHRLTADTLALDLAQGDAGLRTAKRLTADALSMALSTPDAGLRTAKRITADNLSMTLSTADAGLRRDFPMTAQSLAMALTTPDAGLRSARRLTAASLALDLATANATLNKGATMTADGLAMTLTTPDAGLRAPYKLAAQSLAMTCSAGDAGLLYGHRMPADALEMTLSTANAGLQTSKKLTAETCAMTLTCAPATLEWSNAPAVSQGGRGGLGLGLGLRIA